jgi:hypothetical protein
MAEKTAERTAAAVAAAVAGPERLTGTAGRITGEIVGRKNLLAACDGERWGAKSGATVNPAPADWKIRPGTYAYANRRFGVRVNRDGNRVEFLPVWGGRVIRDYMANGFGAAMIRRVFPFLTARGATARGATFEQTPDGFVLTFAGTVKKSSKNRTAKNAPTPTPDPTPVDPTPDPDPTPVDPG